jgi:hypothetical protein
MNGKILKIKTGYNPNSSSIGADIIVFFTAGAAVTILFNTVAAIVSAAKAKDHGCPEGLAERSVPAPAEEQE